MDAEGVEITDLHEALVHAIAAPIVAVDGRGAVVEWNRAAERYTGVPRDDALGTEIWNLQARIAPAVIPYEEALTRSKEQFSDLMARDNRCSREWNEEYDWDILSTRGEVRHAHTTVFPLIVRDNLVIVNVLDDGNSSGSSTEQTL